MGAFMNGQAPGATDGPGSSVGSNDQRGAILPLMAIMLVVLMGNGVKYACCCLCEVTHGTFLVKP